MAVLVSWTDQRIQRGRCSWTTATRWTPHCLTTATTMSKGEKSRRLDRSLLLTATLTSHYGWLVVCLTVVWLAGAAPGLASFPAPALKCELYASATDHRCPCEAKMRLGRRPFCYRPRKKKIVKKRQKAAAEEEENLGRNRKFTAPDLKKEKCSRADGCNAEKMKQSRTFSSSQNKLFFFLQKKKENDHFLSGDVMSTGSVSIVVG